MSAAADRARAARAPAWAPSPREASPRARPSATHLVVALAGFALLSVAQLYAFAQIAAGVGRSPALKLVLVLASGAFLAFTLVALARQATLMTFAYAGAVRAGQRVLGSRARWPTVSILVPAHNEARRIEKALEAILALDYPALEVVVVDDGSTDATLALASRFAGAHGSKRVRVLTKPNGGKWSALNLAFHSSTGELVVCVDADSQLAPDCLQQLVGHFDDPTLGGCCGQVSVRNRVNLVTRLQALEYHLLNGMLRQAQSAFASVLVAPGPISMFRRRVLEEVWQSFGTGQPLPVLKPGARVYGPWEDDTFAEDADLTLNVLLTGHGMTYEPLAISRTSAPDGVFKLLNQRYRWTRGNFQAVAKAWKRWHHAPRAPRALPLWLGTFLLETLALPVTSLLGWLAFVTVAALFGAHSWLAVWFVALTAVDLNEAAFSLKLEKADRRLLALTPLSRLYYSVLLDVSKLFALFDELRGKRMRWS